MPVVVPIRILQGLLYVVGAYLSSAHIFCALHPCFSFAK